MNIRNQYPVESNEGTPESLQLPSTTGGKLLFSEVIKPGVPKRMPDVFIYPCDLVRSSCPVEHRVSYFATEDENHEVPTGVNAKLTALSYDPDVMPGFLGLKLIPICKRLGFGYLKTEERPVVRNTCYFCKDPEPDHPGSTCPCKPPQPEGHVPRVLSRCRGCGDDPPDHIGRDCPVKLAAERIEQQRTEPRPQGYATYDHFDLGWYGVESLLHLNDPPDYKNTVPWPTAETEGIVPWSSREPYARPNPQRGTPPKPSSGRAHNSEIFLGPPVKSWPELTYIQGDNGDCDCPIFHCRCGCHLAGE